MGDINWTQHVGILAFGSAAVATWLIARDVERYRRPLVVVGCIYALFAIEVVVGLRHDVDTWLRGSMAAGVYADRRGIQAAIIALLVVTSGVAGLFAMRLADRTLRSVFAVCGATLTLFLIESVSLHQVDAVLYRFVGGVKLIAIAWLVLAILAVMAVRRLERQQQPVERGPGVSVP